MASITRRGPGQFRARVRRAGYPDKSETFPTRELAERWARQVEAAVAAGTLTDDTQAATTTLGEALARYAREVTPGKRSHRQEARRIAAMQLHPLAARTLAQLRTADLVARLAKAEPVPAPVRPAGAKLATFLRRGVAKLRQEVA